MMMGYDSYVNKAIVVDQGMMTSSVGGAWNLVTKRPCLPMTIASCEGDEQMIKLRLLLVNP